MMMMMMSFFLKSLRTDERRHPTTKSLGPRIAINTEQQPPPCLLSVRYELFYAYHKVD